MTTLQTLKEFTTAAQHALLDEFQFDSWRSTSLLIQLLVKQESYYESINEAHPDQNLFDCQVAISSALELINSSYNVPCDDERFEAVSQMYDAVVNTWIRDMSDDAWVDFVYLGGITNFLANMRVDSINEWIADGGPSETKFEALKLAKRDAKAVELATKFCSEILFQDTDA